MTARLGRRAESEIRVVTAPPGSFGVGSAALRHMDVTVCDTALRPEVSTRRIDLDVTKPVLTFLIDVHFDGTRAGGGAAASKGNRWIGYARWHGEGTENF